MRYWSLLFLLVALACTGVFLYAPLDPDWWFLSNPSALGRQVDHLFLVILYITGAVFIGTQLALAWATWTGAARPGRKAVYSHGSKRLELVWTIIPAGILVFITLYQLGPWAELKFASARPTVAPLAEVTGRQFQWTVRYAGPDGLLGTEDDLHAVNDLRTVRDEPAVILLKSEDVIHSFFLPQMRIKQDALPGLTTPVWFDVDRAGTYELVCAELCGWGHYKMRATLTVYDSRADFDRWMDEALRAQSADRVAVAEDVRGEDR